MKVLLVKIGKSQGIKLPRTLLKKYGIEDKVQLTLNADSIIVKAVQEPRKGWANSFKQMHENGEDQLLIPDIFEDENP